MNHANADWRKVIAADMHTLLKPLGYRKKQFEFARELLGVIHFVGLQSSMNSTRHELQVTVNLGVLSQRIDAEPGAWIAPPGIHACKWRQRIGNLSPLNTDKWWFVHSDREAKICASEICSLLADYGLPILEKLNTHEALDHVLQTGQLPQTNPT